MTEIQNNTPSIPQQPIKVEQVKPEVADNVKTEVKASEQQIKEINEIQENPADRSAVKVDNLENDIKQFTQNPDLAEKALAVAEIAEKLYEANGIENPELKALNVSKAFVEEFQK